MIQLFFNVKEMQYIFSTWKLLNSTRRENFGQKMPSLDEAPTGKDFD